MSNARFAPRRNWPAVNVGAVTAECSVTRVACLIDDALADIADLTAQREELLEALEWIAKSADDGDGWTSDGHERCTERALATIAKATNND